MDEVGIFLKIHPNLGTTFLKDSRLDCQGAVSVVFFFGFPFQQIFLIFAMPAMVQNFDLDPQKRASKYYTLANYHSNWKMVFPT